PGTRSPSPGGAGADGARSHSAYPDAPETLATGATVRSGQGSLGPASGAGRPASMTPSTQISSAGAAVADEARSRTAPPDTPETPGTGATVRSGKRSAGRSPAAERSGRGLPKAESAVASPAGREAAAPAWRADVPVA